MNMLGRIQSLSIARTLQEEEIQELKELTDYLFDAFRVSIDAFQHLSLFRHTVRKFQ